MSPSLPTHAFGAGACAIEGSWTIAILGELFLGTHCFEALEAMTGANPAMIAARLRRLEADGLVERRLYCHRPQRFEYHLTTKGAGLYPVLAALAAWDDRWQGGNDADGIIFVHGSCGRPAGTGSECAACGSVPAAGDLEAHLPAALAKERSERLQAFRSARGRRCVPRAAPG